MPGFFKDPEERKQIFPSQEPAGTLDTTGDQANKTALLSALAEDRNNQNEERLSDIVTRHKDMILSVREKELRSRHDQARQRRRLEEIRNLETDAMFERPELVQPLIHMEGLPMGDENALEKEGIEHLQNIGAKNRQIATIIEENFATSDTLENSADFAKKRAILDRMIARIQSRAQDRNIAEKAGDFVLSFVDQPIKAFGEAIGVFEPGADLGDQSFFSLPGDKLKDEGNILLSMSVEELQMAAGEIEEAFIKNSGLIKDNLDVAAERLAVARGNLTQSDEFTYNTFNLIDAVTPPGAGLIAKRVTSLPQIVGNRVETANMVADKLKAPDTNDLVDVADAVEESLPSGVIPETSDLVRPYVGVSSDVADKIEALGQVKREIDQLVQPGRLSDGQYADLITEKIQKTEQRFQNENIVDFKVVEGSERRGIIVNGKFQVLQDDRTGVRKLAMYLGKKTGDGGYVTEKAARQGARNRGFDPEQLEYVENIDGHWFIKYEDNVAETGIAKPELNAADFPNTGRITSWVRSADNVLPEVLGQARHIAEGNRSRLQSQVFEPLFKEVKKVTGKERRQLENILALSEQKEKWFNLEELVVEYERAHKRMPTDQDIVAYYAAKEMNDVDFDIRNNAMYKRRAVLGFKTFTIQNDSIGLSVGARNGRVLENPAVDNLRIFDADNGSLYKAGELPVDSRNLLDEGQYRIIELEDTFKLPNGDPVKYVIANQRTAVEAPLREQQLGYRAGGHRLYRDKWFVKQAREGSYQDGTGYMENPLTHIVGKTQKQVQDWADNMEIAREAYNNVTEQTLTPTQANKIIQEATGDLTFDKFDELVREGKIDAKHEFEVVFDQDLPAAYSGRGDDSTLLLDNWHTGEDTVLSTQNRMYYSGKGEHLKNPADEFAEILAPYETLARSINNAMSTEAFSEYVTRAQNTWVNAARPFLQPRQFGENPTVQNIFHNGRLLQTTTKADVIQKLEASRNVIKRFMSHQGLGQAEQELAARNLAAWIEGKGEGFASTQRQWVAGKVMDNMSANPISAVRGAVFDMKLGFFDPGQYFLQTQTAAAALAVDPVNGARAAAMYPFMRLVTTNLNENVLDYVARRGKLIHAMDVDEYKTMIRTMIKQGEMDVGGELIELANYSNSVGGNKLGQGVGELRRKGRMIFNEAERTNRAVAWHIAWRETRSRRPDLAIDSEQFAGIVKQRAVDFGQNMRSASAAGWQRGVFSVPTQFLSYQARLLENMLPKQFGGNPRFSADQKMRLAMGQFLLYGAGGLPVFDYAADQWRQHRGEDLTEDQWRLLQKGMWDNLFFHLSGGELDTDFSSRAGVGSGYTNLVKGWGPGGQNSFLKVAAGPSGTVAGDLWDSVRRTAIYFDGAYNQTLKPEDFRLVLHDVADNISTVSRTTKAAYILKLGRVINPKNGQTVTTAEDIDALAALLGIPLAEETELWDRIEGTQSRKKYVREMAGLVAGSHERFFQAMERGDEKGMDQAQRETSAWLAAHSDNPLMRKQIVEQAWTILNYSDSQIENARQRYEERLGRKFAKDE